MQSKSKYETLILSELRGFPEETLPMVIRILHSLKESLIAVKIKKSIRVKSSGLCGIWEDNRSADEIIHEIHSNRTGFGGRDIKL
ncbi:MAG: hypothetical protein Q7J35_01320 [Candidatus Methanoperedens sp.]|nr:hypothetical protein [Candidatus Methanoperedens sp.]